jgi:flavoprotein
MQVYKNLEGETLEVNPDIYVKLMTELSRSTGFNVTSGEYAGERVVCFYGKSEAIQKESEANFNLIPRDESGEISSAIVRGEVGDYLLLVFKAS